MTSVTRIIDRIEQGDPRAAEQLLPLVYEELRKLAGARLANEQPGQSLSPTDLVHEAYLRLVDDTDAQSWNSRAHFFGAAANAMSRIILNRVRDKGRLKRGGGLRKVDLEKIDLAVNARDDQVLMVDEAIEALACENPQCAELVRLRFYAGLTINESAATLGISPSSAKRNWAFARAWIYDALQGNERIPGS